MDEPGLELELLGSGEALPGTAPARIAPAENGPGAKCPRPFSALFNVARKPAGSNHHGRRALKGEAAGGQPCSSKRGTALTGGRCSRSRLGS